MEADSWLRDYRERLDGLGRRSAVARDALGDATGTATAANGAVTATVSSFGALQSLSFGDRADELSRPRLAEAVLEAARKAHREAARRGAEALSPVIGGPAARHYLDDQLPPEDHRGGLDDQRDERRAGRR